MFRSTTAALALLSLAATAFSPAPTDESETVTTVHRFEDPCGVDGDAVSVPATVTGDRHGDIDICAVEVTSTVDDEGVLVGLALALEVGGDVNPGPGRAYTVRLESVPRGEEAGCAFETTLHGRTGEPEVRDGLTTCDGTSVLLWGVPQVEDLAGTVHGGSAALPVTWSIDGGRVDFTFDLDGPHANLAGLVALLESATDGMAVKGSAGAGRDAVGVAEILVSGSDSTELFPIPTIGEAPGNLDPTLGCAELYGFVVDRFERTLCTADVGGAGDGDGALNTVQFTVGLMSGAAAPDRLQLRLDGGEAARCVGQVDVQFVSDGDPVVTADSWGCAADGAGLPSAHPEPAREYTTDVTALFLGTTTRPVAGADVAVGEDRLVVTVPTPTGDANLDAFLRAGRSFETLDVGIGAGYLVEGIRVHDVHLPG